MTADVAGFVFAGTFTLSVLPPAVKNMVAADSLDFAVLTAGIVDADPDPCFAAAGVVSADNADFSRKQTLCDILRHYELVVLSYPLATDMHF